MYAWKPLTTEPENQWVQKGFMWPFFKLSPPILSMIGFQDSGDSGALQVYDQTEGYWVAVDIDHVIEVWEGQHIFLWDCFLTTRPFWKKCHRCSGATIFVQEQDKLGFGPNLWLSLLSKVIELSNESISFLHLPFTTITFLCCSFVPFIVL